MSNWLETLKLEAARQAATIGQPRHAVVTSVDASTHAVKVTIQPEGLETGWIPDCAIAANGLKIVCPAEIGTQVFVVPVEGDAEHPIVVARIFDTIIEPPVSPATGVPVRPGELGLFLDGGDFIHLTKKCLFIKGLVHVDGSIAVTGDVVASGISLVDHVHSGVVVGSALSGTPRPTNG